MMCSGFMSAHCKIPASISQMVMVRMWNAYCLTWMINTRKRDPVSDPQSEFILVFRMVERNRKKTKAETLLKQALSMWSKQMMCQTPLAERGCQCVNEDKWMNEKRHIGGEEAQKRKWEHRGGGTAQGGLWELSIVKEGANKRERDRTGGGH